MSREQQSHVGLKGATVTENIEENLSFSEANKTIGGYADDSGPADGATQHVRNQLPRFSSNIEYSAFGSRSELSENCDESPKRLQSVQETHLVLDGSEDDVDADDDDDDDFFYGDYLTNSNTQTDEKDIIVDSNTGARGRDAVELSIAANKNPELLPPTISNSSKNNDKRPGGLKRKLSISSSVQSSASRDSSPTRSITPPPSKRTKRSAVISKPVVEEDDTDAFFTEITRNANRTSTVIRESSPELDKRTYKISFISKLEGSIDKKIEVKAWGKSPFTKILPSTLDAIVKAYRIPKAIQNVYKMDNVTLYWNGAKILNFMTCNSLRIPQNYGDEITDVNITLVSKEYEMKYEVEFKEMVENELSGSSVDVKNVKKDDFATNEYELQLEKSESAEPSLLKSSENVRDGSFIKLALVGQDNKKIFVKARSSTLFKKIADYYKDVKNLPSFTKLKLTFDHVNLSLEDRVEDHEMEDEDMIEVAIV